LKVRAEALREGEIAFAPKVLVGEAPEARRVVDEGGGDVAERRTDAAARDGVRHRGTAECHPRADDVPSGRYATYGPDHLSEVVRAIDAYFTDLSRFAGLPQITSGTTRASCVLAGGRKVVEQRGIEPLT
jgi:hypothetical protein